MPAPGHRSEDRPRALSAERLFDGFTFRKDAGLVLRGGRVEAIFDVAAPPRGLPVEHHEGLLVPGFVDLQVNGGGGLLLNDDPSADGVARIAAAHRACGTTSLLPTLISPRRALLKKALHGVSKAMEQSESNLLRILGIHVEGPHLNPARSGAHERSALRPLEVDDLALLSAFDMGATLVTLAPECVPAGSIRKLCAAGIRVFAGHSEATALEVRRAREEGLCGFTHLFNAMPPLAAREPGVAGAALADPGAFAGIIADGAHVDWAMFRAAYAALGAERLFLVSDAMPPVGVDGGVPFTLGGAGVETRGEADARHCVLPDGTLAGSCLSLAAALRNAHRFGELPLEAALQMATSTPAAAVGMPGEIGTLRVGARADVVLLDTALQSSAVWVGGQRAV